MERYEVFRENANKHFLTADRFLNFTFRVVNEPKMLLGVVENLFVATMASLSSLLYFELLFKFIPPFPDTFEGKINAFKPTLTKYALGDDCIVLIKALHKILVTHDKCPVEFVRDNAIVMCSSSYDCETITSELVFDFFKKAKLFIEGANTILKKNERNYRRIIG